MEASDDQRATVWPSTTWNGLAALWLPNGRPRTWAPSPSVHACTVECAGVGPMCVVHAVVRRLRLPSVCASESLAITASP
jgi:hypothetical protein